MDLFAMTENLRTIVDHASDADVVAGLAWYDKAKSFCDAITRTFDLQPLGGQGVVAALSPQVPWDKQEEQSVGAVRQFLAGVSNDDLVAVSRCTNKNAEKGRAIALGGSISAHLSGPKVEAFFRNLCGDKSVVTLDRWAVRAAIGLDASDSECAKYLKGKKRQEVIAAYETVAAEYGWTPADCQAVVWEAARNQAKARDLFGSHGRRRNVRTQEVPA